MTAGWSGERGDHAGSAFPPAMASPDPRGRLHRVASTSGNVSRQLAASVLPCRTMAEVVGSIAIVAALGAALAMGWFALASWREGEGRATRVAAALAGALLALSVASSLLPSQARVAAAWAVVVVLAAFASIWVLPVGRGSARGGRPNRRVDERDIMFARGRLRPGTLEYEAYYAMRPEHRAGDDRTRALPGILSPDATMAHPSYFAAADASFDLCESLRDGVDGEPAPVLLERSPEAWSADVKTLARGWGALEVGITEVRPYHVYTHVGRGTGRWGEPVELNHRWAVAFTVEMDHRAMSHAPGAPVIAESARQYAAAAQVAVQLASFARRCGYPARAHIDGNYRVIAPLVARDAGLGDIGRMGLVMTPRLGPRVRLGVVTTDLPLVPDQPADDPALLDFCAVCRKCADNCPVAAIPRGEREPIDGGWRWRIEPEACYRYWNLTGTDCGACMRVCPYSHPDSAVHTVVRWMTARSGGMRRVLLQLDHLFYGRRPEARPVRPA